MKFDVAESASKIPILKSLPEHLFRVTVLISISMETEGEALDRGGVSMALFNTKNFIFD